MKRVNNIFETICSMDNIISAAKKRKKAKGIIGESEIMRNIRMNTIKMFIKCSKTNHTK